MSLYDGDCSHGFIYGRETEERNSHPQNQRSGNAPLLYRLVLSYFCDGFKPMLSEPLWVGGFLFLYGSGIPNYGCVNCCTGVFYDAAESGGDD